MNKIEINKSAEFAWKKIKPNFNRIDLDSASEEIILEYLRSELTRWQLGETITAENSAQTAQKVLELRRQETSTFDGVSGVLTALSSVVPTALEALQRERDEEAKQLAASMPVVKA